ncbi:hypothetical protein KC336_g19347, partial [Hortaea werneckii]
KGWFRDARTEKFVEAQAALGLGNASSTLHPLQDGINEWGLRSSCDSDQPTSNNSRDRQEYCKDCDKSDCWYHPQRLVGSQKPLGDTICGKSSIPPYDDVAQPSPSDWGRDDRISQSGGDWASGLGFAPSSHTHAGSHVEVTSVGAEVPDAQKFNVHVLDGQDAPANVKQYTLNLDCELSALLREVAWDFCRSPRSMKLSYRGQMVQPTDTPKKCQDNGDLAMSADISLKSIGTTFNGNQPDEVAQRLQKVTCGLADGLIKAVRRQAEPGETVKRPKEIEEFASNEYFWTTNNVHTGRMPSILNCAASGEVAIVFNFRFQTRVTMCRLGLTRELYEAMEAFAEHARQPLESLEFFQGGHIVRFFDGATVVDNEMADGDLIEVSRK